MNGKGMSKLWSYPLNLKTEKKITAYPIIPVFDQSAFKRKYLLDKNVLFVSDFSLGDRNFFSAPFRFGENVPILDLIAVPENTKFDRIDFYQGFLCLDKIIFKITTKNNTIFYYTVNHPGDGMLNLFKERAHIYTFERKSFRIEFTSALKINMDVYIYIDVNDEPVMTATFSNICHVCNDVYKDIEPVGFSINGKYFIQE